jgi:phosphatidylglycerol lysyltransferase
VVPVLVLTLLLVALRTLEFELAHLRYHDIVRACLDVPRQKIFLALISTIAAYAVLPGYDLLALHYAGHPLPWRRVLYGSIVAYGVSQTLGFAAFTGGSLRVRLWSAWGLRTGEITKAVTFAGATFALGVVALTGVVGLLEPTVSLERLRIPVLALRALAGISLAATATYVGWSLWGRGRELTIRGFVIPVPTPKLVAGQLLVATIDWAMAALVLYVMLPGGPPLSFTAFLAAFLLAQTGGLLSHLPGGLGVFETLMVLQLGGTYPAGALLGTLLAYRAIFYLAPFVVAVLMLVVHEIRRQHQRLSGVAALVAGGFERWAEPLLPTAIGLMTMLGGSLLLFSGATPPVRGRIAALIEVLPLGVIELSHFAGSVAGAGLVVLGWALARRLDAAFHLTRGLLVVGIGASLLKGLDYEEALSLGVVFALLTASRSAFSRKSSVLAEPLTPGWIGAIIAVVGVSVWVGVFSFKHVEYTTDLWWRFAERGDAPRFLRASAGVAASLGVLALLRLLRHAAPQLPLGSADELAMVRRLLPTLQDTSAALALLGDKHLMFSNANDGFLMYGVSGRSWVALGDPYGLEATQRELAWRFREEADRHGAWPVFYEVSAKHLPLYIDLGLTLLKMGEEALVPLADFNLDGRDRRGLRRTQREAQKAGATFEVLPAARVEALLPQLRAISDEWLSTKSTREKGFSLGRFAPAYVTQFPHALIRVDGRVVAFANLWTGNGRELSVDLMRYGNDAPAAAMEYLFIELMLWGRANGFDHMSLGMAPLSGLEARALAPRWHRFGGVLYRHGEHFYNFRGLRAYKEKFDPVWAPRYLATPAGLALPRVLANVTSLISGGISGLFTR